jgi:RHS repeat-associated protein
MKDGEAAAVDYLHNALGQRVFKSQPLAEQTLPDEKRLGRGFISWLKERFGWLFTQARPHKATLGLSFAYDEDANLIGEYDNGSAQGLGSTEYIWLPVEGANAIPVGIYRNGKFYQVHSDHLGTPRLVTDNTNAPVWQWPYSAFGNNRPTGVLAGTTTSTGATTLKATKAPVAVNLRFPGQYFDEEASLSYNYFRSYDSRTGRYTQYDPIGLRGGLNGFAYVAGEPLTDADPNGLNALAGARVGAAGGFAVGGPVGAGIGAMIGAVGGYLVADALSNYMEARSKGSDAEARPPDVNPGKDCDGNCKPCPPNPPPFNHAGDAHGSDRGFHTHQWQYHQAPDCTCRARKVSW